MSTRLAQARERERTRVMREVSAIAVHLFSERGYGNVRMEDLAEASGVSVGGSAMRPWTSPGPSPATPSMRSRTARMRL